MKELVLPLQRQVYRGDAVLPSVVQGVPPFLPKAACCYPRHRDVVQRVLQNFGKRAETERGKPCRHNHGAASAAGR